MSDGVRSSSSEGRRAAAMRLLRPEQIARRGAREEFIVIGLGRFGTSVAKSLVMDFGYEVLAVDADKDRVQHMSLELPNVVQLDATNEDALRQVGVETFDTGLVCIGSNFEANVLATVLLLRFGVKRVIAKALTATQREILLRIGAHEVILPEHEAGLRLARRLAHSHVVDFLEVSPEVNIVEAMAPPGMWGRTLKDCNFRQKYRLTVIAIHHGDDTLVTPAPDHIIREGDLLVLVGSLADAERLE
ncbi:MAG: TrkA family potassium uptake protein [Caldilineae bacterium]|nr:TrkA family potassium uptake protein [Chloroflexota bacterium]MCB9175553.1 TrkA family potassium uptake protein [Caldilineae bacterium]